MNNVIYSSKYDYEVLDVYMKHAKVMIDVLAVEATAREWKEKYGWDLPDSVLNSLVDVGALISPELHFQNQNFSNPKP